MPPYTYIDTPEALADLMPTLLRADAVAVDTEFVWERTYFPNLGLIQLATGPVACWLVDTVRISDLSALAPLLQSETVVKILHDAVQDLAILRRATGASPRRVFDTRLAAGFAGLPATLSLQALMQEVLGRHIPKGESRSNWIRRPLSAAQLNYAVEDVDYLPELRTALKARCTDPTVCAWMQEELDALDAPEQYEERAPELAYLRIQGAGRLQRERLSALRELANWREGEARRRDLPRGFVLHDRSLLAIAQAMPVDLRSLRGLDGLSPRVLSRVGDDVLAAVQTAREQREAEYPPPFPAPDSRIRKQLKGEGTRLLDHINSRCTPLGIDPALVASRRDAESWIRQHLQGEDASDHPFATGWRRNVIHDFVLPIRA